MAKYLIVGPSWVGDMVMAQSLFKTLCARDQAAQIDVVAPAWSTPVLARMPEVRRAVPLAIAHREWGFVKRLRAGQALRAENYDCAIVLPRSWKSALVPFFARVKKRVGFVGEQRFGLLTEWRRLDKTSLDQTVKRFVSLGLPKSEAYPPKSIPQPSLRSDPDNVRSLCERFSLADNTPAVALMPGAEFGPAKQWPLAHFREVARHMLAQGYQVWVIGGPADSDDGTEIVDSLPGPAFNLCGRTGLDDAIDLIASARLAVSNDSGLMHVAAAVGTYVHVLYGSTSAQFTPPLTTLASQHSLGLSCSPCFQRRCRYGHYDCLRKLEPARVISAF